MRPTRQTKFGDTEGNCFPACLASLLELPLETIPNFCHAYGHAHMARTGRDWLTEARSWLHPRGWWYLEVAAKTLEAIPGGVWHVMAGPSPRGDHYHSVVGSGGAMIFDPHPSQAGLKRLETFGFLIPRHHQTGRGNCMRADPHTAGPGG